MQFGNFYGPGCRPVATVQYSSQMSDGWKNQPVVENPLEDSLLLIKTLGFLLLQLSVRQKAGKR
jgi:hypothetical protein